MRTFLFLLKYIVSVGILVALSALCGLQMVVFPFAIALACALISAGHKFYIIAPLSFAIIIICFSPTIYNISSLLFALAVFGVLQILIKRGVQIKVWVQCLCFVLSQALFMYFQIFTFHTYVQAVLYIVCSTASFYIFRRFFIAFASQSFLYRFKAIDLACLCFLIIILAGGVSTISVPYVSIYHLIGVFSVILLTRLCNAGGVVIFGILYGLGNVITFADLSYVAVFALLALVAYYLKTNFGVYSVLGMIITESMLGLYFGCMSNFSYITVLETLVAGIVFFCIPKSYLQSLRVYIVDENKEYGIRDIANRNRSLLKNKLLDLSNVFFEMDIVFKKMLKGVLPVEEAKKLLVDETIDKVCSSCKERLRCSRQNNGIQKEVENLMNMAFEKGKVNLLDIPSVMANNCTKTSQMLIMINKLISQYKQYTGMIKNLDNSRLLIAEQLHGVAKIMKNLSLDFDDKMSFDNEMEAKILDELEREDVSCCEAIVYSKDKTITSVVVVAKTNSIDKKTIEDAVSNVLNIKMDIAEVKPSETSGWSMVRLQATPVYKVMYGFASACKNGNEISGDCHSMLQLNDEKFLLAISDGMGHGEKARKNSELTISVIENFYKAGFDNDIVLSSVNKLININQMEDFATLDVCVIDLKSCFVDFIKLGASETYLRHEYSTDVIEGKSLPLGVVDEINTSVQKSALEDGDIIIMCSDGVSEAFGGSQELYNFINHMEISSPQEMANTISKCAQNVAKGLLNDDVTIVVARVYRAFR